jgi:hypothetical protein
MEWWMTGAERLCVASTLYALRNPHTEGEFSTGSLTDRGKTYPREEVVNSDIVILAPLARIRKDGLLFSRTVESYEQS